MRRRLQTQVLTIKLPSPGGGQRLKRLGGPGFDFTNVIDKVTARNLVNVNGTKYYEGLHIIWGVIQSLMKTATNQIWITNSINQWQWQWEKTFVGPGCPRMKLWTELVRTAVRAEVPDYEVMQTMAMVLGGLENNDVGDDVIRRLAIWFRFDPVTWLKLMGNITNLDVLLCHWSIWLRDGVIKMTMTTVIPYDMSLI